MGMPQQKVYYSDPVLRLLVLDAWRAWAPGGVNDNAQPKDSGEAPSLLDGPAGSGYINDSAAGAEVDDLRGRRT